MITSYWPSFLNELEAIQKEALSLKPVANLASKVTTGVKGAVKSITGAGAPAAQVVKVQPKGALSLAGAPGQRRAVSTGATRVGGSAPAEATAIRPGVASHPTSEATGVGGWSPPPGSPRPTPMSGVSSPQTGQILDPGQSLKVPSKNMPRNWAISADTLAQNPQGSVNLITGGLAPGGAAPTGWKMKAAALLKRLRSIRY